MNPAVHVLATCRNPELFPSTRLVFDTIRIGFPTFDIRVQGNDLDGEQLMDLQARCHKIGAVLKNDNFISHPDWIVSLISAETEPFVICDTDLIFFDSVEAQVGPHADIPLRGQYIPKFKCPFTNTITMPRFHTALMRIDPMAIKEASSKLHDALNRKNPFWTGIDLVRPMNYVVEEEVYFHDTMGQAYHSVKGMPFSQRVLERYSHIGCGSYLDLLEEKVPGSRARQEELIRNPERARGLWRQQQTYYESRAA